ncbi:MAG TPA: SsrA-binding protein SmpB [Bacilli bacterium]|jgi:SsrA-binding protein|nr:SsrA-binding protein SmpB [Bacilli bacterium]
MEKEGIKILVKNSKAHYNYFLSDFLECGIALRGTEIKSLRINGASLNDAYVIISNSEAFILNMHIALYDKGNIFNHDPLRTRKLLLHKMEIIRLRQKIEEKGFTVIPTKIYLKHGLVKVEIALGKGKKNYDKREALKERDDKRMMDRIIKNNGKGD